MRALIWESQFGPWHSLFLFLCTEHRRAVEKLIEERRAEFVHRKEMEVMERKEEEARAAERRAIVEQERQKLLREHATKLLGYLPKVHVCCMWEGWGRGYGSSPIMHSSPWLWETPRPPLKGGAVP